MEAAMAAFSQRPDSRSRPSVASTATKTLFHRVACAATTLIAARIARLTVPGCPITDWATSCLHDSALKRWGWACKAASSSHSAPTAIRTRRAVRPVITPTSVARWMPWVLVF